MGLDMIPIGKPRPGFENRFNQIYRILHGQETQTLSLLDKLKGRKLLTDKELITEWQENQISSLETIKAPVVGRDKEADAWVHQEYLKNGRGETEEMFASKLKGFYVVQLSKELDGVPVYIAMGQDENVFRGQFMNDCVDLIGEELVGEAWETKLAPQALDYGNRLMAAADKIATDKNLQYLKTQRMPPDRDEDSIESKLHIVFSLAKWLIFYGKNGHGYHADY